MAAAVRLGVFAGPHHPHDAEHDRRGTRKNAQAAEKAGDEAENADVVSDQRRHVLVRNDVADTAIAATARRVVIARPAAARALLGVGIVIIVGTAFPTWLVGHGRVSVLAMRAPAVSVTIAYRPSC